VITWNHFLCNWKSVLRNIWNMQNWNVEILYTHWPDVMLCGLKEYWHIYGISVMNNNGFWIWGLVLLALLYNYSWLEEHTFNSFWITSVWWISHCCLNLGLVSTQYNWLLWINYGRGMHVYQIFVQELSILHCLADGHILAFRCRVTEYFVQLNYVDFSLIGRNYHVDIKYL
jgi:hypothetical protein